MNSAIQLQEYQNELNSKLGKSEKIDFAKDDYHGSMGTLYEILFNYGNGGTSLDPSRRHHIPILKGHNYIQESGEGFSATTKGELAFYTYIETLVNKINQVSKKD